MDPGWEQLAEWQAGMLSRRQLNACGVDRFAVRNQVRAGRWVTVGPMVVATITGDLTWEQLVWAGHLHAGPASAVAGLTAARCHGLRGWDRGTVEVVIPAGTAVGPLPGVTFTRSRRDLQGCAVAASGDTSSSSNLRCSSAPPKRGRCESRAASSRRRCSNV